VFCGSLAFFSIRLVVLSREFNDVSQGNDATPLWIPQLAMALGSLVLLIAMVDDLVQVVRGKALAAADERELKAIE
jgi:TRAP-type C4-dicarboxylate transport system permease small subunit